MEVKTVPEVGGGVPGPAPTPRPKRAFHSRRIPSRSHNKQIVKGTVSRELDNNDNVKKDTGALQDQKKSYVRDTPDSNNEVKAVDNNRSSISQILPPGFGKRTLTGHQVSPNQIWKSQTRPSTAPPVVCLSVPDVKSETTAEYSRKELNDFLKGTDLSELTSVSYQDVQKNSVGPNSSHQPEELVYPSLTSCLKSKDSRLGFKKSRGKSLVGLDGPSRSRPSTVESSIVTFAPETVNIERENKPRRARSHKNNRRPKFAHPCCGHFLPPDEEIIPYEGTVDDVDNSYTKYTQIWVHPEDREPSNPKSKFDVRRARLEKLLEEVSQIHQAFNTFSDDMKARCLKKEIIPRYVMSLDIVLTDGGTGQVESLVRTIESSIRVLQAILHDDYFDENGKPKEIPQVPPEGPGYLQDLGSIISALNKISSNRPRQETSFLGLEAAFAKLQFELLSLSLCPVETVLFRCVVSVIPFTLRRIKKLLQEAAEKDDHEFFIRWVNNSVLHRDYMAILKELGYADENGAKDGLPSAVKKTKIKECLPVTRPFSADADLRSRSVTMSELARHWT